MDGFTVSSVFDSTQASDYGLDTGWTVCSVNGQHLSSTEIQEVVTSGEPFSITFQTQPLKDREVVFFRSTISSKVTLYFSFGIHFEKLDLI